MTASFAERNPALVAALRSGRNFYLELGADGLLGIDEPDLEWTPIPATAEALAEVGLPASLEALFCRPEGDLSFSGDETGELFKVWCFDEIGWLGCASDPDPDVALRECAAVVARSLAALEGHEPIPVKMSEFMRTGRLGPVEIGMSRSEVEALLGPPEDLMPPDDPPLDYRRSGIWKYHDIELYFFGGDTLEQISRSALMHHVEPVPSRALTIDFDFLVDGERPTYSDVEAQARALGLDWEYLVAFDEVVMLLSSGVFFMFETEWDEDGEELRWDIDDPLSFSESAGAVYIGINPDYVETLRAGRLRS